MGGVGEELHRPHHCFTQKAKFLRTWYVMDEQVKAFNISLDKLL